MNDLSTINKRNNVAVQRAIDTARAGGKFVALKFSGLNADGFSAHDTEAERDQAAAEHTNAAPGNRVQIFNPAK